MKIAGITGAHDRPASCTNQAEIIGLRSTRIRISMSGKRHFPISSQPRKLGYPDSFRGEYKHNVGHDAFALEVMEVHIRDRNAIRLRFVDKAKYVAAPAFTDGVFGSFAFTCPRWVYNWLPTCKLILMLIIGVATHVARSDSRS